MTLRNFREALEAKFNTKHPPKGSIICSEILVEYLTFKYKIFQIYDLDHPFDTELKNLKEWADRNGVLSDLEDRVYTWSIFMIELNAMKIGLFLDLPDAETKTLFAICHPDMKMNR